MSNDQMEFSSFAELAEVIEQMPVIVRNMRRVRRLSVRGLAAEVGVSFTTIHRVETGADHSSVTLCALLRWLDAQNPAPEESL